MLKYFVINVSLCPHNIVLSTCSLPTQYCVINMSLCPHNTVLSTCPLPTQYCYQHVPLPTQYCVINTSLCLHNTVLSICPLPTQYCVINMYLCPSNTVLSTCRQPSNTCLWSGIHVLWHFLHLLSGDGQTCDNPVCTGTHREVCLWLHIYRRFEVSLWQLLFLQYEGTTVLRYARGNKHTVAPL